MLPHAPHGVNDADGDPPSAGKPPLSSPARTDPFALLGEPFTTYARLLLAADDARQRLWHAQVGDRSTVREAELAADAALSAVAAFERHGAAVFLLFARLAAKWCPGAMQAYLDPAFRRELDVAQDALRACEDRIEELEDAVVRLEAGEGVPA